ncbi:hypothetical protein GCM10022199_26820 [Marihabitans asiaticum]|uniref:Glycosyltransferase involved in cell wall biosynthesis n=1 Tax=Marihabitans asiaticum TaxID=415218 RepID=A0A560WD43_9MICO|nr:glycosyltransferase family 4 protein [Marihabitans asiaticum]TWD15496.1 glycosyltransferase involved in cell wall biosynthesis [Marihabitans asiaticum]
MRVTIVYGVPPGSRKFDMWHDGFTAAVEVLSDLHDIEWINALSATPQMLERAVAATDVVLVKSSFGGAPDAWSRPVLAHFPSVPTCLMISGTGPPRRGDLGRFDVLFHETDWYLPFVARHPNVIHAFGVDTTIMRPRREVPKDIDWLMVGQPAFYKRPDELLSLTGRRVLVGDLRGVPERTIRDLVNGGIDVLDFVPYHELAEYYARATTVVVACTLHGGGERSVLEARACGTDVRVPEDNPKLRELLAGPIHDHQYYARQLAIGLTLALEQPMPLRSKLGSHAHRRTAESRWASLARRALRGMDRWSSR